ncbi:neurotensin receptor type 1-like [Phlebotomus papatasi]|uniref:neurotensin receptor type 1-like n=1 Tax=Phlebotomus papatasi TaxID=29031 RepID=UPI0024839093|nr:neurotensin receptor type 1-like [Phlebotomus papatasi]
MNNTTFLQNTSELALEHDAWSDFSKPHPLYIVLPVTLIYSIIFLTGVLGNVITCIVISNHRSMHTATNYYLFSLAISDLLLLISGVPQEIYNTWYTWEAPYPFTETICILQGFAAETSANATVLTITAFTVERYMAICHPFLSHTMSKLSRAIKFILAIWVISMCMAVPQIWNLGFIEGEYCTLRKEAYKHVFLISTVLVFAFPMVVITVLYVLIGLQLRKSKVVTRGTVAGSSVRLKVRNYASRHVVNMLVAVVVAFFICWAPQHSQRLYSIYAQDNSHKKIYIIIYQAMNYTSGILYYLSTCINPFLYSIMSYKFREAFKETIVFSFHRRSPRAGRQGRFYRTVSQRSNSNNSHSANTCSSICSTQYTPYAHRRLDADFGRLSTNAQRPLVVSFRRFAKPRPGDQEFSIVPISEKSSDDPTSSTASVEPILKSQCCGMSSRLDTCCGQKMPPSNGCIKVLHENSECLEGKAIFAVDRSTQSTLLTRSDENLPQFVHEAIREDMYTPGHQMRHLSQTVGMQQSIFHTVQEKAQQFVSRHVYIDFSGRKSNRSPYDSPEMSNSSKQLEENLQKILEEVVLHPTKHAKPKRRVTDFIRLNGGKSSICCLSSGDGGHSKGTSENSVQEGERRHMAKSRSLPTFSHLNVSTSGESSQQSFYYTSDIQA